MLDARGTKEERSGPTSATGPTEPWLRTVTIWPGSSSGLPAESTRLQFAPFALRSLKPGWRRKAGGRTWGKEITVRKTRTTKPARSGWVSAKCARES